MPDGRPVPLSELPTSRALRGESVRGDRNVITSGDGREHILLVYTVPLRQGEQVERRHCLLGGSV